MFSCNKHDIDSNLLSAKNALLDFKNFGEKTEQTVLSDSDQCPTSIITPKSLQETKEKSFCKT